MKKLLLFFVLISQVAFSQTPRSRTYLQSHFQTGDKPTQADYYDWIASSPNLVDDTISSGKIWSRKVSSAAPSNGQSYVWNSSTLSWEPQTITGQVTQSGAQTLSNKVLANATIDYNANTITNLPSQLPSGYGVVKVTNGTPSLATAGTDYLITTLPTTPTLSGTTGTIQLSFSGNKNYKPITQTGNITFTAGTDTIEGGGGLVVVNGDASHTATFSGNWINGNGNTFDNTKRNRIFYQYSSGEYIYNILKSSLPDVTAPTFVSASTNSAGTLITVTVSESVGADALTFKKNGSSYTGTLAIVGSTVTFTPGVAALSSDVIVVNGTISDAATTPNTLTLSTDQAVTNNVATFIAQDDFTGTLSDIAGRTTPTGGKTWLHADNIGGTNTFAMSGGTAHLASGSGGGARYVIDAGARNVEYTVTIGATPTQNAAIAILYTDVNNFCYVFVDNSIGTIIGGTAATVQAASGSAWVSGDIIDVTVGASTLLVKKNGSTIYSGTAAGALSGTKFGFSSYNDATAAFDSIAIK